MCRAISWPGAVAPQSLGRLLVSKTTVSHFHTLCFPHNNHIGCNMPTDVETDFVLCVDRNRRVDERRREERGGEEQ